MKSRSVRFYPVAGRLLLTGSTLMFLAFWSSRDSKLAQAQGVSPVPPAAPDGVNPGPLPLRAFDLEHEPALQGKVSFEARHRLLSDLLADLQQQSGVKLMAAPDSPATRVRVTAFVKEMSLAQVMGTLIRLYGIVWIKAPDGSYLLQPSDRSEVELKILQRGDVRLYNPSAVEVEQSIERSGQILAYIKEHPQEFAALRTRQGEPLAKLPVELQEGLRGWLEKVAAAQVLTDYSIAVESSVERGQLRITKTSDPVVANGVNLTPGPGRASQTLEATISIPRYFEQIHLPLALPTALKAPATPASNRLTK